MGGGMELTEGAVNEDWKAPGRRNRERIIIVEVWLWIERVRRQWMADVDGGARLPRCFSPRAHEPLARLQALDTTADLRPTTSRQLQTSKETSNITALFTLFHPLTTTHWHILAFCLHDSIATHC